MKEKKEEKKHITNATRDVSCLLLGNFPVVHTKDTLQYLTGVSSAKRRYKGSALAMEMDASRVDGSTTRSTRGLKNGLQQKVSHRRAARDDERCAESNPLELMNDVFPSRHFRNQVEVAVAHDKRPVFEPHGNVFSRR